MQVTEVLMKKNNEIEMYDEGLNDGNSLLSQKIEKLLGRREDLEFDWRSDLIKILNESYIELSKLENINWNKK